MFCKKRNNNKKNTTHFRRYRDAFAHFESAYSLISSFFFFWGWCCCWSGEKKWKQCQTIDSLQKKKKVYWMEKTHWMEGRRNKNMIIWGVGCVSLNKYMHKSYVCFFFLDRNDCRYISVQNIPWNRNTVSKNEPNTTPTNELNWTAEKQKKKHTENKCVIETLLIFQFERIRLNTVCSTVIIVFIVSYLLCYMVFVFFFFFAKV